MLNYAVELNNSGYEDQIEYSLEDVSCMLVAQDEFELEGLRGLLENRGAAAIDTVSEPDLALRAAYSSRPAVIIMVVSDHQVYSTEFLQSLHSVAPASAMIVLCGPSLVRAYLPVVNSLGASDKVGNKLLLRSVIHCGDRLRDAIQEVLSSRQLVAEDVLDALVKGDTGRSQSLEELLSPREYQVLALAADGASNSCIARRLGMSSPTIGNILTRVFAKLGLHADSDTNLRMKACRELFIEAGTLDAGALAG